jgi:hypothetical protein
MVYILKREEGKTQAYTSVCLRIERDACLFYGVTIPFAHDSIAALASGFGASRKLMTKLSVISATPMALGLTASTSGFGSILPKQQMIFLASLISSDISPTSRFFVCV